MPDRNQEAERAATVDEDGLPPLPQPMRKVYERPHGVQELLYYTAEQVRQAQRDAVAADRQARHGKNGSIDSDDFRYLVDQIYGEGRHGGAAKDEISALIAHIHAWAGNNAER